MDEVVSLQSHIARKKCLGGGGGGGGGRGRTHVLVMTMHAKN